MSAPQDGPLEQDETLEEEELALKIHRRLALAVVAVTLALAASLAVTRDGGPAGGRTDYIWPNYDRTDQVVADVWPNPDGANFISSWDTVV